jgi:hypothetical protein
VIILLTSGPGLSKVAELTDACSLKVLVARPVGGKRGRSEGVTITE